MSSYVIDYELCSLIFMIIISLRFFTLKLFPNIQNKIFSLILVFATFDIIFDVLGSVALDNSNKVTLYLCYVANGLYFFCNIILPLLLLLFVLSLAGQKIGILWKIMLIPAVINTVLLLINPFTGILFSITKGTAVYNYSHGSLFYMLYVVTFIYLILSFVVAVYYRNKLRKNEIIIISLFIIIVFTAIIIQMILPRILLTGTALTVSVLLMYLAMENPESSLDSVTSVFNYSTMRDYFRYKSKSNNSLRLILIDVGGMRKVNNNYGIKYGNTVLFQVGSFFNSFEKKHCMCFQTVSTKFLIILKDKADENEVIGELKKRFDKSWGIGNNKVHLLLTCRYTTEKLSISSADEIENLFDMAFSEFAGMEYGTCRELDKGILQSSKRYVDVVDSIRHALRTDQGFSIRLQPIKNLKQDRFQSAEVLIRLNDPNLGFISPAEFIPIAEKAGLIKEIDQLVIQKTAAYLREHNEFVRLGLEYIEINLSAGEFLFDTSELSQTIYSELKSLPYQIYFEITETAAIHHPEILSGFMKELTENGYKFALDDFGTGYAGVSRIANLPFSIAKIDRSFIISEAEKDKVIVEHISRMFRKLGLITIAEGVETPAQADRVMSFGIDEIQGFLYSKPLTENEFTEFMTLCNSKTNN